MPLFVSEAAKKTSVEAVGGLGKGKFIEVVAADYQDV